MKTLLKTAAVAAVIALSGAFSASAEAIKVGFSPEAYPPFYSQDFVRRLGRMGSRDHQRDMR